jgi:hypothetical protein
VTTSTTPPEAATADARPSPRGVLRATPVLATVGVVLALVGLALLLRPVHTPAQDCGTSLAFILGGRVDVQVSETDPPEGITPAEAKANNAQPCRHRVAEQVGPAAVLFGVGLVAALGAAAVEVALRLSAWLRRRRAARSAT